MSSFLLRPKYPRNRRSVRRRNDSDDDNVALDWNKSPKQILYQILYHIVKKETPKGQKLGYLNCFNKYCVKYTTTIQDLTGFTIEDVLCCVRSSLLHESVEVRAAGIRAFRYFIQEATHVQHFYRLNLDFLVVRSVDIVLDNKAERMQALRLIRKLLSINPSNFSPSFTRCLLAIAKDGHQKDDKDVILRTCLATLSELLLLNPTLCQRCRVIPALMDALLNASHSPLIIEAIVGSLLYTMNDPDLRSKCSQQLSLHKFIAPFTDYPYVSNNPMSNFPGRPGVPTIEQITDSSEFKDHRLATTRFILLSLFRSWPGFLYMCSQPANHIQFDSTPNNPKTAATNDSLQSDPTDSSDSCVTLGSMSALHCLLSMLRMPFEDTRRVLLEFFFELFYLPLPDWTDDFEMARTSISSLTNVPDQWALYDGFVASEAKNLLPSLSVSQNLFENHLSLLLHVFIRADLLSTLTTIIIESACVQNSVRATLLLGELLYLTSRFLPAELSQRCHGLAPLLHACVDIERSSQQRAIASAAVSCLQRMHSLQKRPLTVHSIFLEMLLQQQTQSINHGMLAQSSSSVSPNTRPMPSFCSSSSSSSLYPAPDRPSKSTSSAKLSNSTSKKPVHLDTSDELKPTPTSSTSSSPPPPLVEPSTTSPIPPSAHRRLLQNAGAREHEDSAVLNAIRRSQTLMREPIEWNWQLICTLLRWPGDTLRRQEDHTQRSFVRRLVQFYKPNSRQFSGLSNNHAQSRHITLAGLYLLRFLLDADDAKCGELLQEFLSDLHQSLAQVANDSAPPTAALSASRLLSSHAAHYFLFIGQLSACNRGRKILEKHGFFDLLLQLIGPESGAATSLQSPTSVSPAAMSNTGISSLATASALATSAGSNGSACSIALNTHCDTFAKLIVSCLHYGPDAPFSRTLLGKVLTGSSDSSRLYATNFLRVLLRLRLRDFGKWALELLVTQLADINEQVNSAAIDILHEACESADLLDTLVALRPSVLHLGDRGVLLIAQLASCPNGLKYLQQSALLGHELQRWSEGGFQMRYARFTEQLLNDTFTLHSRADDLSYGRRVDRSLSGATSIGASSSAMSAGAGSTSALFGICGVAGGWRREAFSPAHLYGSLAAHAAGVEILNNERTIDRLQRTCCELCCVDSNGRGQVARVRQNTPLNLLKLKAMIWSIGHIGSSSLGVQLLSNSWLLIALIRLTGECSILSVRAVGFYSLGLIGRSESGRQFLAKHGWTAVRHSRHERWPVCEQMLRGRLRAAHAPHLILPQDENMEGDSLDVNVKYSGVEEDHDNHINGDHQNSSHELRQLNRQFERNVHLQQSRDSMLFIDADETDRQQRIARPTSVNVRHWIESDRQQIDQDSIHKSFDTLNPNDSINSTVLPEIASLDENESFHGLGSSINEPEVSDSEPVPIDSEGAKQPFGLPEPVLSPDNVKKTCADKTLASDAIVRTTDRKYPALGTYLLQQRNARPHSQTLPNKRTQRPHSQTHLSPYSSGFNSAGVPRRKISEPTGCAAPSIYQSCSHLYFTSSGQCALCCSSIDARGRTQSGLDDSDPYNRSQTESFGGSSASSNPVRLRKLSPISNLGGCVNRFTVGPSSVGAYPKSGVQSHPGTILGSFTNSCHSLVQLDCALDYSMPSAQDALGYAAWNEIQRKKDRFSALDELIATGDRSLLAGSALGDFSQELLNAPNSLILSGIESPFNDRLLLSSLAMRSGTSSSDILADTSGDLATNRLFAKEPNSFRNEPSARYMGISLPEDLEQLFTLNKSTENEIELLPEDELYMKPLLNHCEGWVLHTDSRCLICRSRHANHLKSQDMAAHSDQRSSRLAGREKISPFVKLHMQQNPEIELDDDGRIQVRREAIKLIQNLSSCVVAASAESRLLNLKQKYSSLFQDICLYSEVCLHFANYSFTLPARKFLQELFQDANFDKLYAEAEIILHANQPENDAITEAVNG